MSTVIETLVDLDRKERVRLETEDGTVVEGLVNQRDYEPEDHLRLELGVEADDARYQLRAAFADGEWRAPELRRADREATDWTAMGTVVAADALGDSRMLDSEDETGHEG